MAPMLNTGAVSLDVAELSYVVSVFKGGVNELENKHGTCTSGRPT